MADISTSTIDVGDYSEDRPRQDWEDPGFVDEFDNDY